MTGLGRTRRSTWAFGDRARTCSRTRADSGSRESSCPAISRSTSIQRVTLPNGSTATGTPNRHRPRQPDTRCNDQAAVGGLDALPVRTVGVVGRSIGERQAAQIVFEAQQVAAQAMTGRHPGEDGVTPAARDTHQRSPPDRRACLLCRLAPGHTASSGALLTWQRQQRLGSSSR